MTGMPKPIIALPKTSLADVLEYLSNNGIDNPSIWGHFDRTDRTKLAKLLVDVDSAESLIFDPVVHIGKKKKEFEAYKARLKGGIFEEITVTLLTGLSCFGVRADITTATNQLDLLVQMQPTSSVIPAFRSWGSHFICECKFHDTFVKVDWVEKLHSILKTHGAKVGVIISKKGIAKVGRGTNINHLFQLIAMDDCCILSICREDLDGFVAGGGVLQFIVDKYVAIQNGIPLFLKDHA
jgi:hypothetical protein